VVSDWILDATCEVAMQRTVTEAMAGRTVALTTVKVHGDPEQVGGSGRHMEEERRAADESRTVSATQYVRGGSSPGGSR
jgi:hypothetical protein